MGSAHVLLLWKQELMDLHVTQRILAEKVFGAPLALKGPLRNQTALRDRLVSIMNTSPRMFLHGPMPSPRAAPRLTLCAQGDRRVHRAFGPVR